MSKKTTKPVVSKTTRKPAKSIAMRIADAAVAAGINEVDVLRFADICKKHKIKIAEATPEDISDAQRINRVAGNKIAAKLAVRNEAILAAQDKADRAPQIAPEAPEVEVDDSCPAPTKALETKPTKTKPAVKKTKPTAEAPTARKVLIEGNSLTAVIRALGLAKWSIDNVLKLAATEAWPISESTVRIQVRAGLKGERGEPAKLSTKLVKAFKLAVK